MSRWPLKYHLMQRDELENELLALCLQLRRSPSPSELAAAAPRGKAALTRQGAPPSPVRRCYITLDHRADFDLPRLLEADDHVRALLGALNEAASLLSYLAKNERGRERGDRHLPS